MLDSDDEGSDDGERLNFESEREENDGHDGTTARRKKPHLLATRRKPCLLKANRSWTTPPWTPA
jgi:hypothetical protein